MWTKNWIEKGSSLWIMWVAGGERRQITGKSVDKPVDFVDRGFIFLG